ncbi:MAG: aminoacyl--tRNA ligase-related protein [Candidatus Paceibacterota bacterium]
MRQTQLFTKTRRDAPADEVSQNAKLLLRGGFIHKEFAGVYSYLPLGLRVLKNIENIIREEMNAIGGQELLLAGLQSKEPWEKSGRWNDDVLDVWFKTKLKNGTELGLATTHEEPLTNLMVDHIRSYKDLPAYPYQFQTKFRNEKRAKSGIMRTREFIMKDLYSFNRNEKEFRVFYEQCAEAYMRIYARVGLGDVTYRTFASGGSFSTFSDEFQTVTEAGEDTIYVDTEKKIAVNEEVYTDEVLQELKLTKDTLKKVRAVEVGNIFPLGTKYSEVLGLTYQDENGESKPVYMGSYGIGPARVMGAIAETFSHEKGIYWPESVAPFTVHVLLLQPEDEAQRTLAEEMYTMLTEAGIDALLDDRLVGAGEKFAESELIGIPHRIIIGKRALETKKVEYTYQPFETSEALDLNEVIEKLSTHDKETK